MSEFPKEADLIFEYLTKRAVHDGGKLPSQIPVTGKNGEKSPVFFVLQDSCFYWILE